MEIVDFDTLYCGLFVKDSWILTLIIVIFLD